MHKQGYETALRNRVRSGVATEPRKHTLKRPRGDTREATPRTHARTLVTHSLSGHLPSTSLQANLPQLLQCRLEAPLQGTLGDCTWTAGALTAPTAQSATSCIAQPPYDRYCFIPVSWPGSESFHTRFIPRFRTVSYRFIPLYRWAVSYRFIPFQTVSYPFQAPFHTRFIPRFIPPRRTAITPSRFTLKGTWSMKTCCCHLRSSPSSEPGPASYVPPLPGSWQLAFPAPAEAGGPPCALRIRDSGPHCSNRRMRTARLRRRRGPLQPETV